DLDGLPDAWEMQYFGSLRQVGTGDFAGDGTNNLAEYLNRSNPANNMLVAWAANNSGQITVPAGLTDISPVAGGGIGLGGGHSLVLKSDHTVVAWGDNTYGQATNFPSSISN